MWILFAFLSAVFAAATTILSKCGLKDVDSDVATAIRTSFVLIFAWLVALITGEVFKITEISTKSLVFLLLSGVATGASWICYFKALSLGEASKVSAVDKSSVILSVLFALILFEGERTSLVVKLICLSAIAVGTFLMTDIKKGEEKSKTVWLLFALLSAVFAAATSILAKVGIEGVSSNLGTAIRTCVVFVMAWLIVIGKKKTNDIKSVSKKDYLFLFLSGIATAASWLCYYYAIAQGQVSVVVPIDKTSVLLTAIFAFFVFKEKLSKKSIVGLTLLTAGAVCMAIFA